MTEHDFVIWLKGFLQACDGGLSNEQRKVVDEQLAQVYQGASLPSMPPTYVWPLNPINPTLPQYPTINHLVTTCGGTS